jgi:transcriptional regulator with XRE-family HTH domain
MKRIDLLKIRKEHKITQVNLATLTKYPQGFISQIENGRVDAPEAFLVRLKEVLDIKDLSPYFLPDPDEQLAKEARQILESRIDELQSMINRLMDMLDKRDERIRELEGLNIRLQEKLLDKA